MGIMADSYTHGHAEEVKALKETIRLLQRRYDVLLSDFHDRGAFIERMKGGKKWQHE